jgi:hypothetical protein
MRKVSPLNLEMFVKEQKSMVLAATMLFVLKRRRLYGRFF